MQVNNANNVIILRLRLQTTLTFINAGKRSLNLKHLSTCIMHF